LGGAGIAGRGAGGRCGAHSSTRVPGRFRPTGGGGAKDALDDAQERADALNDQITALQRQRAVDQGASQQVQGTLDELQRKQADLQEQVAFYKGIISPGAGGKAAGGEPALRHDGAPRLTTTGWC